MKINCSNCQAENNPDAKYCSVCGHALPIAEVPKSEPIAFERKPKKKKSALSIAIFVVCFWAAFFAVDLFTAPNIEEALATEVANTNKKCPMSVDEYTTLNKVVALPNRTIQYQCQLNQIEKAEVDMDMVRQYVFPELLNNVKTNPQVKTFRDNDVTVKYSFTDKNGEAVTDYVITPEMYK